jgi:hypothetical protein
MADEQRLFDAKRLDGFASALREKSGLPLSEKPNGA